MKLAAAVVALIAASIVIKADGFLTIDRDKVGVGGDLDAVYNVDTNSDDTLTNWVFATNFIGSGSNLVVEYIDQVLTNGNLFYRVHPE